MTPEKIEPGSPTRLGKPFLSSRTAEWLLATVMGLVLVKQATLSGVATVVSTLPWAKDFGALLTFVAPELDRSAPWISGVALALCAFSISSAANPRHAFGWWTLDIFVLILALYVLGTGLTTPIAVLASACGLAAARSRGKYWPILIVEKFMAWFVMGCISFVLISFVTTR